MARVLLCGARGMLGRRLHEAFGVAHDVVPSTRVGDSGLRALDIADPDQVRRVFDEVQPDWVVNAAAYTAVDRAEEEEDVARRANATGPGLLAEAARDANATLLHVSTDFVFDGRKPEPYVETDPVAPLGAYARTKAAGERAVTEAGGRHVIFRVSWLYGPDGGNFVATMLRLAAERDELRVVADQRGTPTLTRDAAASAVRVLEAGVEGVIHSANQGVTTWHELAETAVRMAGLATPVHPIATEDYPTPAQRPANSALRNAALEATIGDRMRPWQEALRDYVER